jgi:hypothetical protein
LLLINFSSFFSCRFSLIANFTPVIIPPVALPFFFSLFVPRPSHSYSFGSDFPLCASFPVSVYFVHLPFYLPSLYTFSRRFVFSSSLLLLKIFHQLLLSLILYKPFPVYLLYLLGFYFHPFPLYLSSLATSLNFFCVLLSSFVKSSSIYTSHSY